MRIIVTGATGFIGSALCKEMLENGHEVIAVVRPGSDKREKLNFNIDYQSRLQILELALSDMAQLSQMITEADVFYHLAWNGSSGSAREDFDIQFTNIGYTAEAMRAAVKCGCSKFIGAGSQAEYGVVHGVAKEDETVPQPFMMYGAAKLAAYQMGQVLAKQLGISFVWPRIYSVYGVGENPGTLVNYVIDSLKNEVTPELSTCENMWNFMYITDCVRALRMLGERRDTEGIYHVASDDTRLLKEFVEEIRDIVVPGAELGFGIKKSVPEKTFWLEPDCEKMRDLGLKCEVNFNEGVRRKI